MLGRTNRFHGRASLQRLYKDGQAVRSGMLQLRYVLRPQRADYRVAIVVSKKVSKKAVVRNRIRRRLYDAVGLHTITKPFDIAITVYDEKLATIPAADVRAEVAKLFDRGKI